MRPLAFLCRSGVHIHVPWLSFNLNIVFVFETKKKCIEFFSCPLFFSNLTLIPTSLTQFWKKYKNVCWVLRVLPLMHDFFSNTMSSRTCALCCILGLLCRNLQYMLISLTVSTGFCIAARAVPIKMCLCVQTRLTCYQSVTLEYSSASRATINNVWAALERLKKYTPNAALCTDSASVRGARKNVFKWFFSNRLSSSHSRQGDALFFSVGAIH